MGESGSAPQGCACCWLFCRFGAGQLSCLALAFFILCCLTSGPRISVSLINEPGTILCLESCLETVRAVVVCRAVEFSASSVPSVFVPSIAGPGGRHLGDGERGAQEEGAVDWVVRDMWWPCGRTLESWRHFSCL